MSMAIACEMFKSPVSWYSFNFQYRKPHKPHVNETNQRISKRFEIILFQSVCIDFINSFYADQQKWLYQAKTNERKTPEPLVWWEPVSVSFHPQFTPVCVHKNQMAFLHLNSSFSIWMQYSELNFICIYWINGKFSTQGNQKNNDHLICK